MSDQKAHIRDIMETSREDLAKGVVTSKTLCGLEDKQMNRLTYATPEAMIKRKIPNACEICRNKWISEIESSSNEKRLYNKFRKLMFRTLQGEQLRKK